jgi:hydrogenase nickel incorporation protein HypB
MSDESIRIIEIKKSVYEDNDREADLLREELNKKGVFLLNLMSSPGAGNTTTLTRTIEALKNQYRI